jgi:hypothetical protein
MYEPLTALHMREVSSYIQTLGRTPLDEWSAPRKGLTYTGDHNTETQNKHPCIMRHSIPRSQLPSDQGLRLRVTGTGALIHTGLRANFCVYLKRLYSFSVSISSTVSSCCFHVSFFFILWTLLFARKLQIYVFTQRHTKNPNVRIREGRGFCLRT